MKNKNTVPLHVTDTQKSMVDYWIQPAVVARSNFVHKSLSSWSFNTAMGCGHGCGFCFVVETSAGKRMKQLAPFGVTDADSQWGEYVLIRPWNEKRFLSSLSRAKKTPQKELNSDGHRAIMYCTTTDPYQSIFHPDKHRRGELDRAARYLVTRSLELIREHSDLNVRILTRSPLAKIDFDLYKTFGHRLTFGMSLPTLRNDIARIYEPNAPAPSQRLATLKAAKQAGLNVYVAMAPVYPDCDAQDIATTMKAIADLDPITVFMEPINIRAENVQRITDHAATLGVAVKTEVFETPETWSNYALSQLKLVEAFAPDFGLADRLHLWPDSALGTQKALAAAQKPFEQLQWLRSKWNRISEWPKAVKRKGRAVT